MFAMGVLKSPSGLRGATRLQSPSLDLEKKKNGFLSLKMSSVFGGKSRSVTYGGWDLRLMGKL